MTVVRGGACMRARLRIENPPGYFVAAAASQIVQTVGVIRSDFGSHTISWVDVCCNNIAFFPQGNVQSSTDTSGALCLAQPWPGMARTIHNDHQRFIETYCQPHPGTERCFYGAWMGKKKKGLLFWNGFKFVPSGYFFTGDGAYCSKKGYYQITGRLDDVINVSGHRIGTAEIEDVVVRSINI